MRTIKNTLLLLAATLTLTSCSEIATPHSYVEVSNLHIALSAGTVAQNYTTGNHVKISTELEDTWVFLQEPGMESYRFVVETQLDGARELIGYDIMKGARDVTTTEGALYSINYTRREDLVGASVCVLFPNEGVLSIDFQFSAKLPTGFINTHVEEFIAGIGTTDDKQEGIKILNVPGSYIDKFEEYNMDTLAGLSDVDWNLPREGGLQ